jgi:3-hydroxybutyrate dehydrogenase
VLAVDLAPDETGPGEPFAADLATRDGNRAAVDAAVERFGGGGARGAEAGGHHH